MICFSQASAASFPEKNFKLMGLRVKKKILKIHHLKPQLCDIKTPEWSKYVEKFNKYQDAVFNKRHIEVAIQNCVTLLFINIK